MNKSIVITDLAAQAYERVLDYLFAKWGIKEVSDFMFRFDQVCGYLAQNPEIYPFVNKKTRLQRCVLTKQNILFFRNDKNVIIILDVFDTRQDPQKMKF